MQTGLRTLVLASTMISWAATSVMATEYQCQKSDSSLRLAIEVKKAGHTLPCEVIVEDDRGERAVLYSAQFDRDYCPARIERSRSELEQEGWSCLKTSEENIVRDKGVVERDDELAVRPEKTDTDTGSGGALLARNGKVIVASRQCHQGDQLRRIRIEVEDASSGRPCELIYWAEGDQTKEGKLLWRAVHDAEFCPKRLGVIVDKWISEGWQCNVGAVQTAAATTSRELSPTNDPASSTKPADTDGVVSGVDPTLEAIIAADADRIGEWMEVEPAIEIAALGDLNDDGQDDAVVFLAYQSDQSAYRQYLMSYLVADGGYELASVKLLTGVSAPPAHARVEQIEEGVIWLIMPELDGSTPTPTGYELRDQQLVEVKPGASN